MRIGVTGHSNLTDEAVPLVIEAIRDVLAQYRAPLTGVTCLARGGDQAFAWAVLNVGGEIEVVLPSADYRERKVKPANREQFEALISKAATVRVLPFETANRDAYAAANDVLLGGVDALVAVWDGAAPDGKGGTGDTVIAARERGVPVTVVWPDGALRG